MRRRRGNAFTLIEMLVVIAIIMAVMAMALPNFIEMMRGRKWSAAVGNVQFMVARARAFASNSRVDMSVEFDVNSDNGTQMWLESELNEIERMPSSFSDYCAAIAAANKSGDTAAYSFIGTVWAASGGTSGGGYNQANTQASYNYYGTIYYGDNARQSEYMVLGNGMTIDLSQSEHFGSYDGPRPNAPYGKDDYSDVRLGINGALVPTQEPKICVKEIGQQKRQSYTVVRCTGRLIKAD